MNALFFKLGEGSVKKCRHFEKADFDLIGDEFAVHTALQEIELTRQVVGNAGVKDFAVGDDFLKAGRGVVSGGKPIGAMNEQ